MKVLFVCEGNVGRSQMATAIFKHMTNGSHVVFSAGTKVIRDGDRSREGTRLGDTVGAEHVLTVLQEIGINASGFTRTQVTQELVEASDIAVVMTGKEAVPEYLKSSPKVIFWEVPDPFQKSLEFTRDIRNLITELLKGLTKVIQ